MLSSGRSSEVSGTTLASSLNPLHLGRELARDIVDDVAVAACDDQRDRAIALVVEEPEADVGDVVELLADRVLEVALRELALGLRRVVDDQRGAPHLLRALRRTAAVDEDASDLGPLAQARDDVLGDLFGVGELRARRQLQPEPRARGILRRQEALRQQRQAPDRRHEDADADQHGDVVVPHRPGDHAVIGVEHHAGRRIVVVVMLHEIGRQHRRDEARGEQREEYLHRHGDAELLEELARDARHEARGREDRDDGERDRDHRQPDLVGGIDRGLVGRFAHPHVAHDVLDLDDGVVDQDAGRQRDGEERDQVQREAEDVHRPEGGEDRQRQRNRGRSGWRGCRAGTASR